MVRDRSWAWFPMWTRIEKAAEERRELSKADDDDDSVRGRRWSRAVIEAKTLTWSCGNFELLKIRGHVSRLAACGKIRPI